MYCHFSACWRHACVRVRECKTNSKRARKGAVSYGMREWKKYKEKCDFDALLPERREHQLSYKGGRRANTHTHIRNERARGRDRR